MPTSTLRRSWISVAAIAGLTTLAALVGASPAVAVDLPFAVVNPVDGATSVSRTPVFWGTGAEGATVTVTPTAGVASPVTTAVLPDGTWTAAALSYGTTAGAIQQVVVTHSLGAATETAAVTFTLAAVPPAGAIVITSPTNGSTLTSFRLVIEGTAPVGSTVTFSEHIGDGGRAPVTLGASGEFSIESFVTPGGSEPFVVDFEGVSSEGLPLTPATLSVLPMRLLAAPGMTSPAPGASLTGSSVVFRGTGIPGRTVSVSAYVPDLETPVFEQYSRLGTADVNAQGTWAVSLDLLPGSYLAQSAYVETYGGSGAVISAFSPVVGFQLAAARASTVRPTLAATGFDATGILAAGGLLSVLGGAMIIGERARRSAREA